MPLFDYAPKFCSIFREYDDRIYDFAMLDSFEDR